MSQISCELESITATGEVVRGGESNARSLGEITEHDLVQVAQESLGLNELAAKKLSTQALNALRKFLEMSFEDDVVITLARLPETQAATSLPVINADGMEYVRKNHDQTLPAIPQVGKLTLELYGAALDKRIAEHKAEELPVPLF